eukprot:10166012-Alexandrium_andersonii.AAC.2
MLGPRGGISAEPRWTYGRKGGERQRGALVPRAPGRARIQWACTDGSTVGRTGWRRGRGTRTGWRRGLSRPTRAGRQGPTGLAARRTWLDPLPNSHCTGASVRRGTGRAGLRYDSSSAEREGPR